MNKMTIDEQFQQLLDELTDIRKSVEVMAQAYQVTCDELYEENEKYKLIIKALEKYFKDHEYYEESEFLRQLLSVTENDMVWLERMAGDDK